MAETQNVLEMKKKSILLLKKLVMIIGLFIRELPDIHFTALI